MEAAAVTEPLSLALSASLLSEQVTGKGAGLACCLARGQCIRVNSRNCPVQFASFRAEVANLSEMERQAKNYLYERNIPQLFEVRLERKLTMAIDSDVRLTVG